MKLTRKREGSGTRLREKKKKEATCSGIVKVVPNDRESTNREKDQCKHKANIGRRAGNSRYFHAYKRNCQER